VPATITAALDTVTINRRASPASCPSVMTQTSPLTVFWYCFRPFLLALIGTGYVSSERGTVLTPTPIDTENRPSWNVLDTLPGPHDDVQQPCIKRRYSARTTLTRPSSETDG
jgi:hypothetical protein